MQKVSKALKSAIISINEATDFSVGIFDMMGEYIDNRSLELHDKYAGETPQSMLESGWFSSDEEWAVFKSLNHMPSVFLVGLYILFDQCLLDVCEAAAMQKGIPFDVEQHFPFNADRAIRFLNDETGIRIPEAFPNWQRVQTIRKLRNIIVNDHGHVCDKNIQLVQSLARDNKYIFYDSDFKKLRLHDIYIRDLGNLMVGFFQDLESMISTD